MSDKEREAFETHIEKTEGSKPRLWAQVFASSQNNPALPAHLEGVYFMRENQKAWLAWQQRAALDAPVASVQATIRESLKVDPPAQELSDEAIEAIGHRKAWRYKASSDPHHSSTYTFNRACLIAFGRALLEAKAQGGSHAR